MRSRPQLRQARVDDDRVRRGLADIPGAARAWPALPTTSTWSRAEEAGQVERPGGRRPRRGGGGAGPKIPRGVDVAGWELVMPRGWAPTS